MEGETVSMPSKILLVGRLKSSTKEKIETFSTLPDRTGK